MSLGAGTPATGQRRGTGAALPYGAHLVQRAARPRCGARSSELQAARRVSVEVLAMASTLRVGTLRGRTAIILLTGFPGAKMKLQYMPMDNEAAFLNFVRFLIDLGAGGLWAGLQALDGAYGGTTGELRARTVCVAARWASSARPTLHLVLRAGRWHASGCRVGALGARGARERGGVRYAPCLRGYSVSSYPYRMGRGVLPTRC